MKPSSILSKFIMAASGLALFGFIVIHLLGNFTLYFSSGEPFNAYVAKLSGMGRLLILAEWGLVVLFLVHIVMAIKVTKINRNARPKPYQKNLVSKTQDCNRSNIASRNMIVTGLVLLGFLILHLWQFRFGPGITKGYVVTLNGQEARDLYRLVIEIFHNPIIVFIYVAVMIFLAAHLRHGFWSAFQSLGVLAPRFEKPIRVAGIFSALVLALGFLGIPIWIYFDALELLNEIRF